MDDVLNPVNAEQGSVVDSQIEAGEPESVTGEVAPPQTEETAKPVQTADENSKFAAARRESEAKLAQLQRDYEISRKYGSEWGVHSESEIIEKYGPYGIATLAEFEEAALRDSYAQKGLDLEVLDQFLSQHPDIQYARQMRQQTERQERIRQELEDFHGLYPGVDINELPDEVKEMVDKGKTPADAYARYLVKVQAEQLAQLKKIEENRSASPGKIGQNGAPVADFVSRETYDQMKTDKRWMDANYDKIVKSMKKW